MVQDVDALGAEFGHHLVIEDTVLLVNQLVGLGGHSFQVAVRDTCAGLPGGFDVVSKTHLKELVQVAGNNTDVTQTFQQWHILAQ